MTTDKIRAAAQMLLEAHDSIAPLREMSSGWDQLRAALPEPAQAAPADDAVQVVAWLHGVVHAESAEPDEALSFSPDNFPMQGLFRSVCQDALVCQRDHLAAMEALRQENERLKAENFALAAGQCIVPGGLRGDESGNQYCSLKADRSAQVAEVMRLVDEYYFCNGETNSVASHRAAIEAAVRKLAGGA